MKSKVLIIAVLIILIGLIIGVVFLKLSNQNTFKDASIENTIASEIKVENEKQIHSIKLSDVSLICTGTDTEKLLRYNGILYGRSYSIPEFANMPKTIAVVDKLIDSDLLPINDCETNSEELLGAKIANQNYDHITVVNNGDICFYNAIGVDYNGMEVNIKNSKIYDEILIEDFLNDITYKRDTKLVINNDDDKYVVEYFIGDNDKAFNEMQALRKEHLIDISDMDFRQEFIDPQTLGNPQSEEMLAKCKRVYGYYKVTKNGEEPIELDAYTHVFARKINKEEALKDVSNGLVSLCFHLPYTASAITDNIICNYTLASSNYTRKVDIKFTQRKDMGLKMITHDNDDYNLHTVGGDVSVVVNCKTYLLEDAISQGIITKHDIFAQAIMDLRYKLCDLDVFYDGGSMEFHYPQLDNKEGYTILKLFTLDVNSNENKDIYIGPAGKLIDSIMN